VYKTHITYLNERKQQKNKSGQAGSRRHCSSHSSVALSVGPDQWCVFCTPSLAVFRTCYNQVNSNLANLDATVKVE